MELTTAIDDKWGSPFELFDFAEFVFGTFDLDAAAEADWKMCEAFISEEQDALNPETEWEGNNIWINPPYDIKSITAFVNRAIQETTLGKSITLLLPVKSDQQWFHTLVEEGAQFIFIRKRVKFRRRNGLSAIGASFPVMLVKLSSSIREAEIISYSKVLAEFDKIKELKLEFLKEVEVVAEEIDQKVVNKYMAFLEERNFE